MYVTNKDGCGAASPCPRPNGKLHSQASHVLFRQGATMTYHLLFTHGATIHYSAGEPVSLPQEVLQVMDLVNNRQ